MTPDGIDPTLHNRKSHLKLARNVIDWVSKPHRASLIYWLYLRVTFAI